MEFIIIIILSLLAILILKYIFKINLKELKLYKEQEDLTKITDKFPSNVEITKEILKKLNNESVEVEENLDSETSLYIALSNKIVISNKKNSCARIQTIAHECLHSIQNRTIHLTNFIFSNFYLLYFGIILVLTLFNVIENPLLHSSILIILSFVQFVIRVYLELDAMIKAKYLAKDYMEEKGIISKEEINLLCNEYDEFNRMGISFYIWNLFTKNAIKIIIYAICGYIC